MALSGITGLVEGGFSTLVGVTIFSYQKMLLDEDAVAIRSGQNGVIKAKQELQELEYSINYASFLKARDVVDPGNEIENWITDARRAAFCLEDQIAMYAIRGLEQYKLYGMKYDIGMLSIRKLTENIQGLKRTMPDKVRNSEDLLEANRFEMQTNKWPADVITHPSMQPEDAKLTATLRDSFLYCLAFPEKSELSENSGIPTRKLLRLWTAEGYVQDSPRQTQEQVAQDLLDELIRKNLLVIKKKGLDSEVLKCSVNERIRPLAVKMCKQKNFCRFMPGDGDEPITTQPSRRTKFFPIPLKKMRPLADRYRMIAVHGDRDIEKAANALGTDIRIRSLLHFRTEKMEPTELKLSFNPRIKLLRTLELQGSRLTRLPSSIRCLVCLRYLGLRKTQLEDLPATLEELELLMCLDIRDTNIAEIADVSAFKEMRHLYLANSFRNQKSVFIKKGLQLLVKLQKLAGVACRVSSESQSSGIVPSEEAISNLEHLTKLSIKKASGASSKSISAAINRMNFLRSLTITCDREQPFDLSYLKIGTDLRKLKLGGGIDKLEVCVQKMKSITYLYLWDSNLSVDPLRALQGLKDLLLLSLHNAYTGEEMSCDCENAYPKLKKLSVISMKNLTRCTFYQDRPGTSRNPPTQKPMRNLEELVFAKCGKLSSPPPGIAQLGSLRNVRWVQMPEEFGRDTKDALRGSNVTVQDRKDFNRPCEEAEAEP